MTQNVYRALRCKDAPAIIEWMASVLGFQEIAVHRGDDGTVHHAELGFEGGVVMLGSASDGSDGRMEGRFGPSLLYLAIDDVDALYQRAKEAGAEISMELTDTDHGSRDFAVQDPEGNVWSFGTYRPQL